MKVVKNSIIYLSASIISKAAPFSLLPFATSYLAPNDFGILTMFLVMNSLFCALVGMSMHTSVTKNFFRKSKSEVALIIGNVFFVLCATTVFYLVISLMVFVVSESFFSIPSVFLLILPILAFLTMANQIHLTVLRNEGRAYTFGIFEVLNAFLSVGVTIFCMGYLSLGWFSQVIGVACASLQLSIIGIGYLYKRGYLNFIFSKVVAVSILKLSIPLIPHVLGGIVIAISDRLFIEQFVGLETVAFYSIGYSFGMIVALFTDALIKAWSPWFYQQLVEPDQECKLKIVRSTYFYLISVFVFAYVISVLGNFILPYVVDARYIDASIYIWWVALGYAFHGVYKIFFPYLVHINKTAFLGFSTFVAAIINLILNYLLIPEYGALGAAYATIFSFFISACLVFEYQRRKYPMPWLSSLVKW